MAVALLATGLADGRRADHTWAFFALAVGVAWLLPRFPIEERVVWLWFGAPLIFMLFFTLTPNTHVYGFFIGWALVAGMVIGWGWQWLRHAFGFTRAAWIAAPVATACWCCVFGNYAYWYFAPRIWRCCAPGAKTGPGATR